MESNNTYEQEIDLKDLMFVVFYKWRPILLAAVILAVLFGGYKVVSTYRSQNDAEAVKAAEEKYQEELELFEKNKEACEREIDKLATDLSEQQNYLKDSVLMNISTYDVWEAKTELFVKTDYVIMPGMVYQNIDYTDTILQVYKSMLTSTEFLKDIAEHAGIETRYLKELVTITAENNLISIQVRHEDERVAASILEGILDGVDEVYAVIAEAIGVHTVSVMNESIGSRVDLALANSQKAESDRLRQLNESLVAKQKELGEMKEPVRDEALCKVLITNGIKYAVLGGVLGAFMVVFFVCVAFLMSDKLYSAKELRNRYKLKVLGILQDGKSAKGVDAWLNRLEGSGGWCRESGVSPDWSEYPQLCR